MDTSLHIDGSQLSKDLHRLRHLNAIGIHALPDALYSLCSSPNLASSQLYCTLWTCECAPFPISVSTPSVINDSPYFEIASPSDHVELQTVFPPAYISTAKEFTVKIHLIANDDHLEPVDIFTDSSPALAPILSTYSPAPSTPKTPDAPCPHCSKPPLFPSARPCPLPGAVIATLRVDLASLAPADAHALHTLAAAPLPARCTFFFTDGVYTLPPLGPGAVLTDSRYSSGPSRPHAEAHTHTDTDTDANEPADHPTVASPSALASPDPAKPAPGSSDPETLPLSPLASLPAAPATTVSASSSAPSSPSSPSPSLSPEPSPTLAPVAPQPLTATSSASSASATLPPLPPSTAPAPPPATSASAFTYPLRGPAPAPPFPAASPHAHRAVLSWGGMFRQASELALHKSIASEHAAVAAAARHSADETFMRHVAAQERRADPDMASDIDALAPSSPPDGAAPDPLAAVIAGVPLRRAVETAGLGGAHLLATHAHRQLAELEAAVDAEEERLAQEMRLVEAAEEALIARLDAAVDALAREQPRLGTLQRASWAEYSLQADRLADEQRRARHRERVLLDELVRVLPVTCAPAENCIRDLIQNALASHKPAKRAQLGTALRQRLDAHFAASGGKVWCIRGVPLLLSPAMLQMATGEMLEQSATGLGHVVQLVMLVAKYSQTPLTHPLRYMGARSCVNGNTQVFPLYVRPGHEKNFLEAVNYLNLNVLHLIACKLPPELALRAKPNAQHLLENLHLLLTHEVPIE